MSNVIPLQKAPGPLANTARRMLTDVVGVIERLERENAALRAEVERLADANGAACDTIAELQDMVTRFHAGAGK